MTIPRKQVSCQPSAPRGLFDTPLFRSCAIIPRAVFDALLFESRAKRTPKATVAIGYAFDQLVKVG